MNRSLSARSLTALAAVALFSGAAGAVAPDTTFTNITATSGASISNTFQLTTSPFSTTFSETSGFNKITATGSSYTTPNGASANGSNFFAYCIDPLTFGVSTGSAKYNATSLFSFLNTVQGGINPNETTTRYQQQMAGAGYTSVNGTGKATTYGLQDTTTVLNNLTALFSHAYNDSLTSTSKSAAFGYAVWEIMGDSGLSRTGGSLKTVGSATVNGYIDALLSAVSGVTTWTAASTAWGGADLITTTSWDYIVYSDPTTHSSQNFIRVTPGGAGQSNNVPTPGSLHLAGLAILGVWGASRRTRKNV